MTETRPLLRDPGHWRGSITARPSIRTNHVAFCAVGGGGSSALIVQIDKIASFCGMRPDSHLLPEGGFEAIMTTGAYHVPPDAPYASLRWLQRSRGMDPSAVCAGFHRQSGFFLDERRSVTDNMRSYIDWMRQHGGAVVLWFSAQLRVLSRLDVPGVVFLVRRPAEAFASFAEPHRHRAQIDRLGGVKDPRAIEVYCRWWLSLVEEHDRLHAAGLAPVLLRYDHAYEDAPDALKPMFAPGSGWVARERDVRGYHPVTLRHIERLTGFAADRLWGSP